MGGLYKCSYSAPDGAKGFRRITAKSPEEAREKILKLKPTVHVTSVVQEALVAPKAARLPATKPASRSKPIPVAKVTAPSPKAGTKLEKLLFRQDNACFFCGRKLSRTEASIEHLQPKSGGGKNDDGNVVACCATLNRTLGNMSLKEKFQLVLKKSGHFTCPALRGET